ncbi:MAG: methionine--tRNA ligase subunit beta [Candidatus Margulisiibacteriota bacterium]
MDNITFDDFKKLDLRVAEIKEVEEVPGADKLWKLKIDCGEEREIVAGIKLHYPKEELIGKKIAFLANLEPKTIRGVTSHGMLMAASNEDRSIVTILSPQKDVPNGSRIS